MSARFRRLRRRVEDRGASAVEYGLMIAAIAALIVGGVFAMGRIVTQAFSETCRVMASSVEAGDTCGGTTGGTDTGGAGDGAGDTGGDAGGDTTGGGDTPPDGS